MNNPNNPPRRVIVRAWGDEPVILWAHGSKDCGKSWIVGAESPTARPITLPSGVVYEYDEQTILALREAFDLGESAKLQSIYATCNTYQNKVDSLHGQANVSSPGGPSGGSR